MYHRIFIFLLCALLIGCTTTFETKSLDSNIGLRDDFFIDDTQPDPIEGSAATGEFAEDGESSSGIGPDDEDGSDDFSGDGSGTDPKDVVSSTVHSVTPTLIERIVTPVVTPTKEPSEQVTQPVSTPTPTTPEHSNLIPTVKGSIPRPKDDKPITGTDDNTMKNDIQSVVSESPIMGRTSDDRQTSFFSQPGILAAVIGGAVVGLLCAILLVMFIVYRMRKKDEGKQYHEKYLNLQ